jgi:hypothetical protein
MKNQGITVVLSRFSLTLMVLLTTAKVSNANTNSYTFSCVNIDGVPTTVAKNQEQQIPMIYWLRNDGYFGENWTPEKRCQEVASKFQKYSQQNILNYLTYGVENGYPIICVAETKGGDCVGQLLTLKKHLNPQESLPQLLLVNNLSQLPEVQENLSYIININNRSYLDVNSYFNLQNAELITNQNNKQPITANQPENNQVNKYWYFE